MIPDITTALEAMLGLWADGEGVRVAWGNIQFDPSGDGLYLISHDMPAQPYSIDMAGGCRVYPGVYQSPSSRQRVAANHRPECWPAASPGCSRRTKRSQAMALPPG